MKLLKTLSSLILMAALCSMTSDKIPQATFVAESHKQVYMKQNPKADFVLQPTDSGKDVFFIEMKYENGGHFFTVFNRDENAIVINKQKVNVSYHDENSVTWEFADKSDSSITFQTEPKLITLKQRVSPGNTHLSFIYVLYMDVTVLGFKAKF